MHRDSVPPSDTSDADNAPDGDTFPRAARRARRPRADRGLPPDAEIKKLAKAYLERQRKHWPALVAKGLLPESDEDVLTRMCENFKERHRVGKADSAPVKSLQDLGLKLGGQYGRFSCENSDPKSIIDQMNNALDRAHDEGRFVPWRFVYADYSVSGLDASRQGYTSYKKVLADKENKIDTTYIDDFTRASRDELEWWKLAALSKRLNRRLIGASDGFSLSDADWDMKLTMYGLLSRLFIKSLRQKVVRGTHRLRGSLGQPPFGFTLRLKRDENGSIVCGTDGQPKKEYCFDPNTATHARRMFELYIVHRKTTHQIAKEFNRQQVDGWSGWTEGGIRKSLANPAAYGLFIWNRTRREFDWEEEKWVTLRNPWQQWERYYDPKLALVPKAWVRQARRELRPKRRRASGVLRIEGNVGGRRAATHLFSDTLVCAYCGKKIRLYRSTGRTKDLYCPNGPGVLHGCQLSSSKAIRIVEECLLRFFNESLFTQPVLNDLLVQANAYVAEEAARPREDLRPKKASVARLEASVATLVRRVERTDDENLIEGYVPSNADAARSLRLRTIHSRPTVAA